MRFNTIINRIIIHESLLDFFKKKALKALPYEVIVAILGKIVGDELHICAFDEIDIKSATVDAKKWTLTYNQPEEEIEAGTTLKYFGTLHSHPNGKTDPSEEDKEDFLIRFNGEEITFRGLICEHLYDEIMGIMSIKPMKYVIHYGLSFYNIDLEKIEIIISENRKRKVK